MTEHKTANVVAWCIFIGWWFLLWVMPREVYYLFNEQSLIFRMFVVYGPGVACFIWGLIDEDGFAPLSLLASAITVGYLILTIPGLGSYTYTGPHDYTLWEHIWYGFWIICGNLGFFGVGDVIKRCLKNV